MDCPRCGKKEMEFIESFDEETNLQQIVRFCMKCHFRIYEYNIIPLTLE